MYTFTCVLLYCTGFLCRREGLCVSVGCSSGGLVFCAHVFLLGPSPRLSAPALLSRALVRLELDELFGHVVVVALGEDAQHRQARLVHVDPPSQRQPAGDAALAGYVLHLQHSHAHGAVLPGKAVVLHAHLQLVALWTHLGAQRAETKQKQLIFLVMSCIIHS